MPTRPVHAASIMGRPLRLELVGSISADPAHRSHKDGRIRINTHSNAYMGQLRRQIAAIAKSAAPHIRLFFQGNALILVGGAGCMGRAVTALPL